ncbi:hypothetical protein DL764_004790 [Monosporascus ibericus]|uniref:Histidine kinase n=1 Tax=Monosporascus ibericus TaxID=155417 RepID=A0A4Q4TBE6_9PEZI|nr:hypothetical protein DL764_004790 [Monosporascus ibericus]
MTLEADQDDPSSVPLPNDDRLKPAPRDPVRTELLSSTSDRFAASIDQRRYTLAGQNSAAARQTQRGYAAVIGYYGLSAVPSACPSPVTGDPTAQSPAEVRSTTATTNPATAQYSHYRASVREGKHSQDAADVGGGGQPPQKKPRTRLTPPRNIDLSTFARPALPQKLVDGMTSPLFFSNKQRPTMSRPTSFSGLEGAGTILNRLRDSPEVTTLKLARGTVSSASPGRSSSTPGSWSSIDAATSARSPDAQGPGFHVLQNIGVLELLERDDRPTFIVDCQNSASNIYDSFSILWANAALQVSDPIRHLISGDFQNDDDAKDEFNNFRMWVKHSGVHPDGLDVFVPSFRYGGLNWTCCTIRDRFRFVSANTSAASVASATSVARTSPEPPLEREASVDSRARGLSPNAHPETPSDAVDRDYFGSINTVEADDRVMPDAGSDADEQALLDRNSVFTPGIYPGGIEQASFDWTRIPIAPDLPEHIRFARSVDWASTPLGPIDFWPSQLRAMTNMVMGSPHPAALYWGRECTIVYNEAYLALIGQKHPALMGQSYKMGWSEIWPEVEHAFEGAWQSGQATMKNDDRFVINRSGFPEETYFSWSIVPLVGDDGSVVGLYNPCFENTRRKVAERRMLTLREVGEKTALARDVKGFWKQVNKGLEFNEEDVPFNLIYSVVEEAESDVSSIHSGSFANPPQLALEASLGVPQGHRCLVSSLDLKTSNDGFAPYMRESMSQAGAPVRLSTEDGTMPTDLMDGFEWRGTNEQPCRSIVIFPIHPTTGGESVVGFVVMGVNPKRPFDDDYKLFINLLSRQLATSLASVVLFEEEIQRGQKAARLAALDRQKLTAALHERTLEVEESELKFTRMAEFAPVGMFIANHEGFITYCNDMWWQITRHSRSEVSVNTWMESVKAEDRPALEDVWQRLIRDKVAITHEFRFKCSRDFGEHVIDTWVLMSAYPERCAGGSIKGIFGCLTDISQQKLAEQIQMHRREEAVELKRQQENFIDITSHEMRNPLSAILQCADEIAGTLTKYKASPEAQNQSERLTFVLDSSLEAANTITLCASHQKRIVDDVLTLSKLDSNLLLVTPVSVQPLAVVQRVLKMFESELNTNDIQMKFNVKNRYFDIGVDWAKLDPSRLLQVLINLMTNAIKFTQTRPWRSITVTLDASRDIKEVTEAGTVYFPKDRSDKGDLTDQPDWGDGEKINLHFSVQDTGRGLDGHERKLLFQRFSQATPRTHVQYGGSGLGLFISRILTELQGGQIGVMSQKGVGSTFSFYIQSRKTTAPPPNSRTLPTAPPLTRAPGSSTTIENKQPRPNDASRPSQPRPAPKPRYADGQRLFDVLIVEDNLVNQKVLQRQLRNVGNSTKVANHGGEALDVLKDSRFWSGNEMSGDDISVILMDLEMPVMDGMTCARKIRELERDGTIVGHIPIIAVTAYARPEQIEDAKAAGVDDVISKPFRMPDLIPRIEQLVDMFSPYAEPVAA